MMSHRPDGRRRPPLAMIVAMLVAACAMLFPLTATASERLLVLVTEVVADEEGDVTDYWWAAQTPQWTATDESLATALASEGIERSEPADLESLSRIYRRPEPSETNALAMASVFGERRLLVGTVRYEPTVLRPVGLAGWAAVVELQLLDSGSSDTALRRRITIRRATWAPSLEEALGSVREKVARSVAQMVAGELRGDVGPVGVDADEPMIGIAHAASRRGIEAVRSKLRSFAGVQRVRESWATEGVVVLELNPGTADSERAVKQTATLFSTEGVDGFAVEAVDSPWPGVLLFRLEEAPE